MIVRGFPMTIEIDSAGSEDLSPAAGRARYNYRREPRPLFRFATRTRDRMMWLRVWYLRTFFKMDIEANVRLSLRASVDFTNPRGIHIGEGTCIAFHAVILAHDLSRLWHADTHIGRNCFVGAHAIVLAGVRIGDECIIGCGAVVTRDVPSHSIVAGNPAKVIRSGIRTRAWGVLEEAYAEVTRHQAMQH